MAKNLTTIGISRETWKALNARKETGDSFEDVLRRILGIESNKENLEDNLHMNIKKMESINV